MAAVAAGIVMPVKWADVAAAVRVVGVMPAHVPPTEPPAAVRLVGNVSVNAALVSDEPWFGLVSVIVTVEVPPALIVLGLN